jgi:hypothetical protein
MTHNRVLSCLRLLAAELAARCYQTDQKKPPDSLEQLVPKYLRHVPLDPFSGNALVYKPTGTNWLLYSVGEDKVDDGGKRQDRRKSGGFPPRGDRFYDTP